MNFSMLDTTRSFWIFPIGGSAGGFRAVKTILSNIPKGLIPNEFQNNRKYFELFLDQMK
ncbi:hypothetical protein [Flavivirga sp. 57AJ16]|uniref:hypothetical protein n=1 Tax=Flavivirga sp. 57AJ16 TaxID=3025307 RepID=UPI0023665263|nr:hypothetical protein [Flavivirga sp. 57AJ16]MDD7887717.1 hypothetical protein [Flavivirga sp. 57AJ16]